MHAAPPLLDVRNLSVTIQNRSGPRRVVDDVTFQLSSGQTLGVVGASGSGKSLTAMAIMRLLPEGAIADPNSRIRFQGRDILALPEAEMRELRGGRVAVVFQEPMACLHPMMRVGRQVLEAVRRRVGRDGNESAARLVSLFSEVGLPDPDRIGQKFPHELSGGQQQRVMIAMALAGDPDLLIADEPTTALDATVQAQILALLKELQQRRGLAMLFVSHDLGVVSTMARDVLVMHEGRVVEYGPTPVVFSAPSTPYTRMLLSSRRRLREQARASEPNAGEVDRVLEVVDLQVDYNGQGLLAPSTRAVHDVSLFLDRGRTLGLIGESGSGKSSIAKAIVGLVRPSGGDIRVLGRSLAAQRWRLSRDTRKDCQIILQNPFGALNPRLTIEQALLEPFATMALRTSGNSQDRILAGLNEVGLDRTTLGRYPHQLSGGQRQRICIARALMPEPVLLICDEIVSALDAHVQVQILDLLRRLQSERRLSLLFIGHDLEVIRFMADDVAVMHRGRVVEHGPASAVLVEPRHSYSRTLIASVPKLIAA